MEAAQMLTAQRIARECAQLARTVEQSQRQEQPERHLRSVEPVTQPLPRIAAAIPEQEPVTVEQVNPMPTVVGPTGAELTELGRGIVAFERQWWKHGGSKERAVRELFDLSPNRYEQLLDALIAEPAARRYDPMLMKRLRKLRSGAQPDRRTGSEWLR